VDEERQIISGLSRRCDIYLFLGVLAVGSILGGIGSCAALLYLGLIQIL